MNSSAASASVFRGSPSSDLPFDVVERAMSLRSEHCSGDSDIPPERRLMIALLRDSIRSVVKHRNARDSRGRRLFAEESGWILSDDMTWIYAFARVCEALDLDPEMVRRALGLLSGAASRRSPREVPRRGLKPVIVQRLSC